MDLLTLWRSIFLLVNYHCHLMNSLTACRHKGSIIALVNNCIVISWIHLLPEHTRADICISEYYHYYLTHLLTSWTHKSSIFVLVNYHYHLMDLLTSWTHKGSIFVLVNYHFIIWWIHLLSEDTKAAYLYCISELPLSFDRFTYCLKTQGQHIWISELPLSFDEFTYSLKQHICISELSLSFDGFTYSLNSDAYLY